MTEPKKPPYYSLWTSAVERYMKAEKEVRVLKTQIEEMGLDPEEAPLYRRISEQRHQLKDLNRLISSIYRGHAIRVSSAPDTLTTATPNEEEH